MLSFIRSCLFTSFLLLVALIALCPNLFDNALSAYYKIIGEPLFIDYPLEALIKEPLSANFSLTRGVRPVSCHSHNDYWRPYPLYSAIHAGCIGVEADIWLYNQELYVGHTTSTLQPNRTLNSMYVKPLVDILDARNPPDQRTNATSLNGIFMEAPQQTLVLLIDFKMDGDETWPYLMEQLNPLREKGYLTHFNGTTRVEGPVTVVGSGNAPYHLIVANSTYRDVFYDAPLAYLHQQPVLKDEKRSKHHSDPRSNSTSKSHTPTPAPSLPPYDHTNSYYASASFKKFVGTCWGWLVSKSQLDTIRSHVHSAHERQLLVRYWSSPSFPHEFRNKLWWLMIHEGVDILNTDDLVAATTIDWGWMGKWSWSR